MTNKLKDYGISDEMAAELKEQNYHQAGYVSRFGSYDASTGSIQTQYYHMPCHANLHGLRKEFGGTVGYYSAVNHPFYGPNNGQGATRRTYGMCSIDPDTYDAYVRFLFDTENSPWRKLLKHMLYTDVELVKEYGFIIPKPANLHWDEVFNFSVACRQSYEFGDALTPFLWLQKKYGATPNEAALICFSFIPPARNYANTDRWDETWNGRMCGGHDFISDFDISARRFIAGDPKPSPHKMNATGHIWGTQAWSMWHTREDMDGGPNSGKITTILKYIRSLTQDEKPETVQEEMLLETTSKPKRVKKAA